ncbi:AAA family ATPase [Mycobacterium sp. SMC-4]|uniref:bifunctional aminoglycoside phosphotransferase/ATP-binding protein n=1 Tax=Mycobacterium sp. SMC-4 TaxID=2857059 RepID=UPI0021B1F0F2|nr:AAA family ATPase [Mycobacterium sp. SMC-4]UXA19799.1 AAA family ATPase [Mycobacterium sp. SMC-4]
MSGDDASGVRVPAGPEIHETHTGIVALVGDRAYKVKKCIRTDFLDFSGVEQRERACRHEVELNRRLAPQAYLGVAHLSDVADGPAEPVIVMRRYADRDRLSTRVQRGVSVDDELRSIAEVLARFHAGADRGADIDADATPTRVEQRWRDNLVELHGYAPTLLPAAAVDQVERLCAEFLAGRAALFAERIATHRIVDGHADLLADDIFCRPEGPVLLDCLEFDAALRHVDGIDDAAFLAMDLEFLGRGDLAAAFLDHYRRAAQDPAPPSLVHFYIAYRAVVRAKTDCIRAQQGRAEAAADARRHLDLAVEHLRAGAVRLILVGGGPGTGKTTLARGLSGHLQAEVISTDDVRRELVRDGVLTGQAGALSSGLYSPEQVEKVYDAVLDRAARLLGAGQTVILDGTWRDPHHRARARELAELMHCRSVEFACTLPLAEAEARIEGRRHTTSDATPGIAAALAVSTAEHDGAWDGAHRLDTGRPLGDTIAEAHEICCLAI